MEGNISHENGLHVCTYINGHYDLSPVYRLPCTAETAIQLSAYMAQGIHFHFLISSISMNSFPYLVKGSVYYNIIVHKLLTINDHKPSQ